MAAQNFIISACFLVTGNQVAGGCGFLGHVVV
jgi:hypothetical protein